MPQLTPDYERVIVCGLLHPDDKTYDYLKQVQLMQMMQEIRISEDYCRSDIIVSDLANYSLAHILKISVPNVKKYELCAIVSSLVIRNKFTRPSNIVISCHLGVYLHNNIRNFVERYCQYPETQNVEWQKTCKYLKFVQFSSKYGRSFHDFPQRKRKTRKASVNTQPALTHTINISTRHQL
jgi:hypothetical protein